jgi:hypothetical protein
VIRRADLRLRQLLPLPQLINQFLANPFRFRREWFNSHGDTQAEKKGAQFFGGERFKSAPPITIARGIDTVEVSAVDLSRLGHGFYAAARSVLTDMHDLMANNTSPDERMGLAKWEAKHGPYWRFVA